MPFVPSPVETYEDPEGLLADWHTYESTILRLTSAGETTSRRDCPAFHCLGDHKHPAVKELGSKFAARAPVHVEELAAILRSDRDAMHRAAAAYLLAYSSDGPWIVAQLLPAFRDGSALVRNNAMRVLSDVAWYHPEVDVPLEPVLEALSYPATTDRNKAAAILAGLLERPGAARLHREVAKSAGATLLAMLRLQQPNNHDFAYRILKAISGQDFGPHNHAAWEAWLLAQQRSQAR
ncbi:MAG: hypothetical protein ACTHU0_10635, partial [Kofleriaceae bacterium]